MMGPQGIRYKRISVKLLRLVWGEEGGEDQWQIHAQRLVDPARGTWEHIGGVDFTGTARRAREMLRYTADDLRKEYPGYQVEVER